MDEKRLLKKLRNGDEKALEKIIDIYSAYISKIVGSLISSKGTREQGKILRRWLQTHL